MRLADYSQEQINELTKYMADIYDYLPDDLKIKYLKILGYYNDVQFAFQTMSLEKTLQNLRTMDNKLKIIRDSISGDCT